LRVKTINQEVFLLKETEFQKLVKHLLLLGDNAGLKEVVTLRKKGAGNQLK